MAAKKPKTTDGTLHRQGPPPREVTRERESKAWALRQRMWTHRRIAEHLGVDPSTVSAMLKRVESRALAELNGEVAAVKARQVAQLERIADEAIQAWERSKEPAVTIKRTEAGEAVKVERTTRGQVGAPDFLAKAMQALADIRRVLGLDAKASEAPTPTVVDPAIALAALKAAGEAAKKLRAAPVETR